MTGSRVSHTNHCQIGKKQNKDKDKYSDMICSDLVTLWHCWQFWTNFEGHWCGDKTFKEWYCTGQQSRFLHQCLVDILCEQSNITIPSKIVYIILTWETCVPAPVCSKNRRWFLVPPDIPLLLRPSGPNFASLWPLAANLPKLAPNLAEKLGLGPQTTCGCGHTCCTCRNQAWHVS